MLIEFKLHAGKVPYFVKRYVFMPPLNSKFYGEALSDPTNYIPDEVVVLEEPAWIDKVKTGSMQKPNPDFDLLDSTSPRTIEMTELEKVAFLNEWLHPTK